MPVSLGMPSAPPPVLAPRRTTRQIQVGSVGVGSQHPVSVQSMTTTKTHDIGATLQQIAELTAAGCDIVRVACPTDKDAEALKVIAQQSTIPVIADIHFQPKYVFAAIEAGCGAVRVNPGNIKKFDDKVKEIAQAASDHGTSIRIGVNAGSLDPRLLQKYGKATPEALVESAIRTIRSRGAAVGMDELASDAGTSKTVFYRHFTDRRGLYQAVAARVDELSTPTLAEGEGYAELLTDRAAFEGLTDKLVEQIPQRRGGRSFGVGLG